MKKIKFINKKMIKANQILIIIKFKVIIIYLIFIIYEKDINIKCKLSNIPKISIFIPIYNKSTYLIKCIKSIQRQTLKDIEIIAVNDFSKDNSLEVLKNLSEKDLRIKIVNNDKNRGLLYTRAMGILNSKADFVMNLDPDDELEGTKSLKYLYNVAKNFNVDIVSFNFKSSVLNQIKCPNYNTIIKQPYLFNSIFYDNDRLKDFLFWNKMVKRSILIKSYQTFKKTNYLKKWNYHEDNVWSILIHKNAKSKICINKVIYIYNNYNESLLHIKGSIIELKNVFYREEIMRQILNNENEKKYIIAEFFKLTDHIYDRNLFPLLKSNKKFKNKLINILKICIKVYKCPEPLINTIQNLTFI